MKKMGRLLFIGLLLVLLGCERVLVPLHEQEASPAQGEVDADPVLLRMAVCWAGLPLAKELSAAYTAGNPRVSVDVVACDSAVARDLLGSGQVDLALVSEMMGCDGEEDSLPAVLALDALVVIVPQRSSLERITGDELSALFGGYHLNWQELSAGRGKPELVVRETGSVARELFHSYAMGEQTVSSAAVVMPHDRAVLEYVAQHASAVGYISRAYVDERVKVLAIDGVPPTQETVREGEYPLVYGLQVRISDVASREATDFVSFMRSHRGRRLAAERYVIPE
ncbi:MAG: substrate-binding domain-containing protein [Anaerolineales bacterium]